MEYRSRKQLILVGFSELGLFPIKLCGICRYQSCLGSILWTFQQCIPRTETLPQFCNSQRYCHSHLQRLSSAHCVILETHGSLHDRAHFFFFFGKTYGTFESFPFPSPNHGTLSTPLSPTSPCCVPASKITAWSVGALTVARFSYAATIKMAQRK